MNLNPLSIYICTHCPQVAQRCSDLTTYTGREITMTSLGNIALSLKDQVYVFNVTGSFCKQHIILNHVFFRYKSSGGKIGNCCRGHGVLSFRMGRTWFKLAVTSSNQFLPVVAHDLKGIAWLVASLHI